MLHSMQFRTLFLIVCFLMSLCSIFCSKILTFPSFDLIHIASRFLSPNFKNFSKIYVSVNSPHFSVSAGIPWKKKQPKIWGEKIRKTRCSYNFDQVKSTFFPFDSFLLKTNRFEKILSWYSDRANLNVYILIDRPIQVEKEEMKIH